MACESTGAHGAGGASASRPSTRPGGASRAPPYRPTPTSPAGVAALGRGSTGATAPPSRGGPRQRPRRGRRHRGPACNRGVGSRRARGGRGHTLLPRRDGLASAAAASRKRPSTASHRGRVRGEPFAHSPACAVPARRRGRGSRAPQTTGGGPAVDGDGGNVGRRRSTGVGPPVDLERGVGRRALPPTRGALHEPQRETACRRRGRRERGSSSALPLEARAPSRAWSAEAARGRVGSSEKERWAPRRVPHVHPGTPSRPARRSTLVESCPTARRAWSVDDGW